MLFFTPDKTLVKAACRNLPEEEKKVFFGRGGNRDAAKKICFTCPIRKECLKKALEFEADALDDHTTGVWGGLTNTERNELRRKMQVTAA